MTSTEWAALSRRVLERDDRVCYVCHLTGADTVDHVLAVSEGGARKDESNLAAIHSEPCHADKTRAEAARGAARRRATRRDV